MKSKFYTFLILNFSIAVSLFSQQGKLDRTFGVNGIIQHSFDTTFLSYNEAKTIAIQPDGKIVVGGRAALKLVIARFNSIGKLDKTFGDNGAVIIEFAWLSSDDVNDLVIQPDGKIVAIVQSYRNDPDLQEQWGNTIIMRFNANGGFDDTFGSPSSYSDFGTMVIETGYDIALGESVALQPDGKILVGGTVKGEYSNYQYAFVARCNDNGSFDSSFANNGIAIIVSGTHFTYFNDMLLLPNSKILFAGRTVTNFGSFYKSAYIIERFSSDGILDNEFSDDGVLSDTLASTNFNIQELMLQADGNVLAWVNKDWFLTPSLDVIKIKPDGSLDASFGDDGVYVIPTDSIPYITKILSDDKGDFYLAGYKKKEIQFGNGPGDFVLAKLSHDFTPIHEFGKAGVATKDINNGTNDRVADAALLPNNKIILAGFASSIYYEAKLTLAQYYGRDTMEINTIDTSIVNKGGLTILPNPVLDEFTIYYPLSGKSIISINLYDSSGRLVYVFLDKAVRDAGMHSEQFAWPNDIVKGVYFVRLSGRTFEYTGKVLKN
ncbi:MAG: T9SS type A sorting domain-containing protein [Saprospiraceae bacterium]|nr:T9SS type A sorting domain-containing protein [Saprospiraceae bacterium]MCF8251564.1 T9SS type A sorting domain-containing protein [Saprospiraceae bacterium]MCF8282835.1 T9SS type A sorting domain-containing protein [Bacteroidales bacterium]